MLELFEQVLFFVGFFFFHRHLHNFDAQFGSPSSGLCIFARPSIHHVLRRRDAWFDVRFETTGISRTTTYTHPDRVDDAAHHTWGWGHHAAAARFGPIVRISLASQVVTPILPVLVGGRTRSDWTPTSWRLATAMKVVVRVWWGMVRVWGVLLLLFVVRSPRWWWGCHVRVWMIARWRGVMLRRGWWRLIVPRRWGIGIPVIWRRWMPVHGMLCVRGRRVHPVRVHVR